MKNFKLSILIILTFLASTAFLVGEEKKKKQKPKKNAIYIIDMSGSMVDVHEFYLKKQLQKDLKSLSSKQNFQVIFSGGPKKPILAHKKSDLVKATVKNQEIANKAYAKLAKEAFAPGSHDFIKSLVEPAFAKAFKIVKNNKITKDVEIVFYTESNIADLDKLSKLFKRYRNRLRKMSVTFYIYEVDKDANDFKKLMKLLKKYKIKTKLFY